MTQSEFKAWKELQLTGIDIIERSWPTTASNVRLSVALQTMVMAGNASEVDYSNFDRWSMHYKQYGAPVPCWERDPSTVSRKPLTQGQAPGFEPLVG